MSIMTDRDQDGRSNHEDPHGEPPRAKNDADPLAELARLIGQTDPFANFGRANPSHPTRRTPSVGPQPQSYSERARDAADDQPSSGPSWMKSRPLENRPPLPTPSPVEPTFEADDTDINAKPHPLHRYAQQTAAPEPDHAPDVPYDLPAHASPPFVADHPHDAHAHEADPYAQSYAQPNPADYPHAQPTHQDDGRYDEALYGAVPAAPYEYDQGQGNLQDYRTTYADGYDESETYADDQKPRRKGLMTVAAVLALAVVGTGGAYAYRNYISPSRSGEPPVIKADTAPIKVVPPTNASDNSSKLIQDRIATGSGGEKLVSREETPVDPRDPSKAGPRIVFPPLNANGSPPSTASVSPAARQSLPTPTPAPGEEPRKIKTFTVKGDQADTAGVPVAKPATRPATVPAAAPKPTATLPSNTPMSLSPQGATNTRVASTNPTQAPPGATGGYVVQVASQRSETDAQASFKALQSKYPSVLGSRSASIKKADLGTKGTYYRAVIGPFTTSEDASALCGNLKSAGGQCVVQRN
jgi:cell division protein FtsN